MQQLRLSNRRAAGLHISSSADREPARAVSLTVRFAPTLESRRVVAVGPDDKSIIECYGQSFRWDPASGHQTIDELEPLRLLGDGPMCASPGILLRREPRPPPPWSSPDPAASN